MVRDQQFGTPLDGFLDDFQRGVDGEDDPADAGGGVPGHEAHLVPFLSEGFGPEFLDGEQDLAERGGCGRGRVCRQRRASGGLS